MNFRNDKVAAPLKRDALDTVAARAKYFRNDKVAAPLKHFSYASKRYGDAVFPQR